MLHLVSSPLWLWSLVARLGPVCPRGLTPVSGGWCWPLAGILGPVRGLSRDRRLAGRLHSAAVSGLRDSPGGSCKGVRGPASGVAQPRLHRILLVKASLKASAKPGLEGSTHASRSAWRPCAVHVRGRCQELPSSAGERGPPFALVFCLGPKP